MIDVITILSASLGVIGFVRFLRLQNYSILARKKYLDSHKNELDQFIKEQWKEFEEKRKAEKIQGWPTNDSTEDFFQHHRRYQTKIAISIVIGGFLLQLLNGILVCLLCFEYPIMP